MRRFVAALLLCFAAATPADAATVTITSSVVHTKTGSGDIVYDEDFDTSTAYGARTLTSGSGGKSATTNINWQSTGTGALFDFDFAQVSTGGENNYALSDAPQLYFSVGQSDTTYSLSGLYSMTGTAKEVFSDAFLYDVTTNTVIFRDSSFSESTANEFFILGTVGDGDSYNDTTGSLTGMLLAGHQYQFYFANTITSSGSDDGATATGCVTLSIGGATGGGTCGVPAVPLPAAAWLLFSGLGGLGFLARRRKA